MMDAVISKLGKTPDGELAALITVTNRRGTQLMLSDLGARIAGLELQTEKGRMELVTRFADARAYLEQGRYHGAVIGRYANRIGGAAFTLNGEKYSLCANDSNNSLHGGSLGFDSRLWEYEVRGESVLFALVSPDMEEGYPGTLDVMVSYTLTDDDEIQIAYAARSDRDTVINLTNHAYFNLDGFNNDVLEHFLQIDAKLYTEPDAGLIPTGRLMAVQGTALDFTAPHRIGERINDPLLSGAGGYDHNYVLNGTGYRRIARAWSEKSGIAMETFTDMPGVQFYTGNFLCGEQGAGRAYQRHGAFCLETQYFPDSPNKRDFPSTILRAGEQYKSRTAYRFTKS